MGVKLSQLPQTPTAPARGDLLLMTRIADSTSYQTTIGAARVFTSIEDFGGGIRLQ